MALPRAHAAPPWAGVAVLVGLIVVVVLFIAMAQAPPPPVICTRSGGVWLDGATAPPAPSPTIACDRYAP